MPQESIGAEHRPNEGHLTPAPTDVNGVMALHPASDLIYYRNPAAAASHDIDVAKAAGVNTFDMLLGPGYIPGSQFDSVINAYWKTALTKADFRMAIDVWLPPDRSPKTYANIADEIRLIHSHYGRAWRTVNGKPLIFVMASEFWGDVKKTRPSDIDVMLAPLGGRSRVYLVLYNPAMLKGGNRRLFDDADAYSDWPDLDYAQSRSLVSEDAAIARSVARPFWFPVMPGFMQSRPNPGVRANVRERMGAASFIDEWKAAIDSDAVGVNLITWNDLSEDTAIMPETNHSTAFAELNRYFSRWYEAGKPPAIRTDKVLLFHHPQITSGMKLPDGRHSVESFGPATPPTDYLDVVTILRDPARVTLGLNDKIIAAQSFSPGLHEWLLFDPAAGAEAGAYPFGSETRTMTKLSGSLWDAEIYLYGAVEDHVRLFRSHRPIVDAAGRSELTTIGDVFVLRQP